VVQGANKETGVFPLFFKVSYTFWHLLLGPWSSQATRLVKVQQAFEISKDP